MYNAEEDYKQIAQDLENEGIEAFNIGHIQPNTRDENLNKAIEKVLDGLQEFENIIEPYRI